MAQLTIREATVDDAEELSELINEIIKAAARPPSKIPFRPNCWPTGS
jgi:hypothetical protein